jgi:hypothetical protein
MSPSSFFLASLLPFLFGAIGAAVAGRIRPRPVPGLLFHSIGTGHVVTMSALSRHLFTRIVRALSEQRFRSVTIDNFLNLPPVGDERPILVTFDDGCRSFYQLALPILSDYDFKVTLFPVAGYLGRSSTWDILPSFPHLSSTEVREISDLGHEIGSHTLTHPDLTFLNKADLLTELKDSKKLLEDITGKPVTALSFPFGSWTRNVWETARECGYTHATLYRRHKEASDCLFPVYGAYRFDTPQSVLTRISGAGVISLSVALAVLMSHFARSAPLWRFRPSYNVLPEK